MKFHIGQFLYLVPGEIEFPLSPKRSVASHILYQSACSGESKYKFERNKLKKIKEDTALHLQVSTK